MLGHHHVTLGWVGLISLEAVATAAGHPLSDFSGIRLVGVQVPEMPLLLAACAFGSLLPDIDHPNAMLANYKIAGIPFLKAASYATSMFVRHRGPTHSLLVWAILTALAALVGLQVGLLYFTLAVSLGYLLHMVGDALTRSGVPFLWPFKRTCYGFPPNKRQRFVTGSLFEYLVTILFVGLAALVVLKLGWPMV